MAELDRSDPIPLIRNIGVPFRCFMHVKLRDSRP